MDKKRPMFLFYFSISLAVAATLLYHLFQKKTPVDANPALALTITYGVSILLCFILLLIFFPLKNSLGQEFQRLNWASYALAFGLVGLEVGFLLAYRAGWNISTAGIIVNVIATVLLVPIGVFVFKEKLTPINLIGILVCIIGLVLVNFKR
jgi:drug/metabolite transporter (DMT)-like permease